VLAVDTYVALTGIAAVVACEACALLALSVVLCEPVTRVAHAAVCVGLGSAPAVDTLVDFVASAGATGWVALVADFAVGAAASARWVALLTLSFGV